MLSGPEPQRTILENKLLNGFPGYSGTITVVRGLPAAKTVPVSSDKITFYNHLPSVELSQKIAEAEFVIGRSGYSTIMDLVQLRKKGILIPTPGQTEQEYLSSYLRQQKIAWSVSQDKFSLADALEKAHQFPYQFPEKKQSTLEESIRFFVEELQK